MNREGFRVLEAAALCPQEVKAIKDSLSELAEDVLEGRITHGDAAVVNQLLNTRLRAIELERRIREQDEVLERIEALEAQRGTRRWG